VLEIIETFFPLTVDILAKDRGMYSGSKPVIFPDTSERELLNFFMSQSNGASIEFGDEQTIIVREEKDKKKLPKILKVTMRFVFLFIVCFCCIFVVVLIIVIAIVVAAAFVV
jgi:hypothetical protein